MSTVSYEMRLRFRNVRIWWTAGSIDGPITVMSGFAVSAASSFRLSMRP